MRLAHKGFAMAKKVTFRCPIARFCLNVKRSMIVSGEHTGLRFLFIHQPVADVCVQCIAGGTQLIDRFAEPGVQGFTLLKTVVIIGAQVFEFFIQKGDFRLCFVACFLLGFYQFVCGCQALMQFGDLFFVSSLLSWCAANRCFSRLRAVV